MKTIAIHLTVLLTAATAVAESPCRDSHCHSGHYAGHNNNGRHYGRYPAYGYGWRPVYHASSYVEGRLRGVAAVLRAGGQRNVLDAQAARLLEDAERMELENDVRRTETYFAKRAINRAATRTDTIEQAAARRLRIANDARPDRLGPTQYRADLGLLNWPAMLRQPQFAETRDAIDALVAAGATGLSRHGSHVHQLAGQMRTDMKPLIREVSPHDYFAASKFLESLQYEAQLGVRGMSVASR